MNIFNSLMSIILLLAISLVPGFSESVGEQDSKLLQRNTDKKLVEASDSSALIAEFKHGGNTRYEEFKILKDNFEFDNISKIRYDKRKIFLIDTKNHKMGILTMKSDSLEDNSEIINGFPRRNIQDFEISSDNFIFTSYDLIRTVKNGNVRDYKNVYEIHQAVISEDRIIGLSRDPDTPTLYVFDMDMKILAKKELGDVNLPGRKGVAAYNWELLASGNTIYIIPKTLNLIHVVEYVDGEIRHTGHKKWHNSEAFDMRERINMAIEREFAKTTDDRNFGFGFSFFPVVTQARLINGELIGWVSASQDPNSPQYLLHLHGDQADVIALPDSGEGRMFDFFPVISEGKIQIYAVHKIIGKRSALIRYYN